MVFNSASILVIKVLLVCFSMTSTNANVDDIAEYTSEDDSASKKEERLASYHRNKASDVPKRNALEELDSQTLNPLSSG